MNKLGHFIFSYKSKIVLHFLNNKLTICNRPDVAFPIFEYRHFIYTIVKNYMKLSYLVGIKLQHPTIEFPFYR